MNVSVLLGHPYEQSFNAAIAVAVVRTLEENGHTVRFHDLYGEGFDPVITFNSWKLPIAIRRPISSRVMCF